MLIISLLKLVKRHGIKLFFNDGFIYRINHISSFISINALIRYDYPEDIEIGKGVYIGDFSLLAAKAEHKEQRDSKIRIGNNAFIGESNNIRATGGNIYIGNDCNISQHCSLIASNHSIKKGQNIKSQPWDKSKTGITIHDDVWIGANSVILPGVTIGKGAVIGAGSVVTHNIPEYAIAVGCPAQIIKYRE